MFVKKHKNLNKCTVLTFSVFMYKTIMFLTTSPAHKHDVSFDTTIDWRRKRYRWLSKLYLYHSQSNSHKTHTQNLKSVYYFGWHAVKNIKIVLLRFVQTIFACPISFNCLTALEIEKTIFQFICPPYEKFPPPNNYTEPIGTVTFPPLPSR